jgi:hypothetical protein
MCWKQMMGSEDGIVGELEESVIDRLDDLEDDDVEFDTEQTMRRLRKSRKKFLTVGMKQKMLSWTLTGKQYLTKKIQLFWK